MSKISAVYEVKQFVVVKNETDPATNEVYIMLKHFSDLNVKLKQKPQCDMQRLSDYINQCDCYLIRLHDHIQDGTLGIPGSCQQVLHLY